MKPTDAVEVPAGAGLQIKGADGSLSRRRSRRSATEIKLLLEVSVESFHPSRRKSPPLPETAASGTQSTRVMRRHGVARTPRRSQEAVPRDGFFPDFPPTLFPSMGIAECPQQLAMVTATDTPPRSSSAKSRQIDRMLRGTLTTSASGNLLQSQMSTYGYRPPLSSCMPISPEQDPVAGGQPVADDVANVPMAFL